MQPADVPFAGIFLWGVSMHIIPIILDTDPGIDDAMAIAAALFSPHIDLKLITTVSGNVSVEKTTYNALRLMAFWRRNIPVARGAAAPLLRAPRYATGVHGESGLAGFDFPEAIAAPLDISACQAIYDCLMRSEVPMTLVAIGPLTNIAMLLIQYPDCKDKIKQLVVMGGSSGRGNLTPYGEFNITVDPEAAAHVFNSGLAITLCGLDVTNHAILPPALLARLPTLGESGRMLHALFSHYRSGSMTTGLRMHDLTAIAWLVKPELFRTQRCFVGVETQGELTYGATVIDLKNDLGRPANVDVALEIDVAGFQQWVEALLASAP